MTTLAHRHLTPVPMAGSVPATAGRRELPDPGEPCGWCARPRGAPMTLRHDGEWAAAGDREVLIIPERICDVCAGLLGFTVYDAHRDGPHARADAYEAVAVLTGIEPLTAVARRRCTWCHRGAHGGWCPTCRVLLAVAGHAAARTLCPPVEPTPQIHAAHRALAAACRAGARGT